MAVQLLGDDFGRVLIGGQVLDRLEAAVGGGSEAVEKPDLLENKAEIGGEFRHGRVLVCGHDGGAAIVTQLLAGGRR